MKNSNKQKSKKNILFPPQHPPSSLFEFFPMISETATAYDLSGMIQWCAAIQEQDRCIPRVSPRAMMLFLSRSGRLEWLARIMARWGLQSPHLSSTTFCKPQGSCYDHIETQSISNQLFETQSISNQFLFLFYINACGVPHLEMSSMRCTMTTT